MRNKQATFLLDNIEAYGWAPNKYQPKNPDVVGVEIEMEGLPAGGIAFGKVPGWQQHEDGSLRGGIEFVSNGPRTLEQVSSDLDNLNAAFEKAKFTPVFSFRTSLHVHVNVFDMSHMQLLNMFTLYTIFEQPLLELGGEERIGNVHCMPVFLASYPVDTLREGLKNNTLPNSFQQLARNDLRYASFNWASLTKFGTIEYRSHRGTADKDTVMRWCGLLMDLKNSAKRFDNPQHIVQQFSAAGLDVFTDSIFNNETFTAMCRVQPDKIWEGLRQVQFMAFAPDTWNVTGKDKKPKKPEAPLEPLNGAWDAIVQRAAGVGFPHPRNDGIPRWIVDEQIAQARAARRRVEMPEDNNF